MDDIKTQTGKQTEVTAYVREISSKFPSKDFQLVIELLKYIVDNLSVKEENKDTLFRARTAEQILKDGFSTGCTDNTLVFIALSRSLGLETKYVETLSRQWLNSDSEEVQGHVVAEVKIMDDWYWVDPTSSSIGLKQPSGMTIMAKGLDSWDIGINNANWNEKFNIFRDEYKKKKAASHN